MRRTRKAAAVAVALAVMSCDSMGTESAGSIEHAWTNFGTEQPGFDSDSVEALTADATYTIYAVIDEDGLADGILTITGDGSSAYDPYEVLIDGMLRRNGDGVPEHMLAEYDRYDGTRCRLSGNITSSSTWSAVLGCGGTTIGLISLRPITTGIVSGTVRSDGDLAEGIRVQACTYDSDNRITGCSTEAYSGEGGKFMFEIKPGEYFITFSVWDAIWDEWDRCRNELTSTGPIAGEFVTVRIGRTSEVAVNCKHFFR